MALDLRELEVESQNKWQVVTATIGGGEVLAEFDNRADAVERAILEKENNPSAWVAVIRQLTTTTYVFVDSV